MNSNCNQVLEENHSVRTRARSAIKWHGFRQPKISKNKLWASLLEQHEYQGNSGNSPKARRFMLRHPRNETLNRLGWQTMRDRRTNIKFYIEVINKILQINIHCFWLLALPIFHSKSLKDSCPVSVAGDAGVWTVTASKQSRSSTQGLGLEVVATGEYLFSCRSNTAKYTSIY